MEQNKQGDNVWEWLGQHWLRIMALLVTSFLTGTAAYYLTGSWLAVLAIVSLSEGASIYWLARVEEFGNKTQAIVSGTGSFISISAIIVTDLASATIIAKMSNLQIFTMFQEVPAWAQNTVVYVIPILAISHIIMATVYHFFSETASTTRKIKETKRNAKLDIERAKQDELRVLAQTRAESIGRNQARMEWEKMLALPVSGTGNPDENPTIPPSKK